MLCSRAYVVEVLCNQLSPLIPLLASPCLPAGAKGEGRVRDVGA
jgi:hypothetical protein